ncbi:MAG: hypothetical protein IPM74_08105 [Crocinitomicaceae bacterium]|nr:hypothetical protein [Crocinitomicaceae bacterium]MBK8925860.1 hypothetical protein [Crocinitomicaceae bacterium]
MKKWIIFFVFTSPLLAFSYSYLPHEQRPRWSFEYHLGAVYNFKTPLTFTQAGFEDIKIQQAVFESEPFVSPHYWDWRFTKWFDQFGISFEAIHHKIYLKNKPDDVQRFGISHGYNMLVFSYNKAFRWYHIALGGGSVLMHPESTVRGKQYPEGPGFDWNGYVLKGYVLICQPRNLGL